jgi:ABC-type transport system involved in cytochrome c biogenesis permease component
MAFNNIYKLVFFIICVKVVCNLLLLLLFRKIFSPLDALHLRICLVETIHLANFLLLTDFTLVVVSAQ